MMNKHHLFKASTILCGLVSGLGVHLQAQAATPGVPVTCVVSRDQVIADIKAGSTPDAIAQKYANCQATDYTVPPLPNPVPPAPWSTTYEEIKGCGYHPQRKEAACRVDIKQLTGYNGVAPAGSLEFVKLCVDFGAGWQAINTNGFHVNDAAAASGNPVWNFAAILPANQTLFQQPLNRQALRARAILSWAAPPGGTCAAPAFVWGNVQDFRIRLDP
jgi:hypothetical protein